MSTIESFPDEVVDGGVVIGPWKLFGHWMRGEMVRSTSTEPDAPATITVWQFNPGVGKWRICTTQAAHTVHGFVFYEPFNQDRYYTRLWRQNVAAKLIQHYCNAAYNYRKEAALC